MLDALISLPDSKFAMALRLLLLLVLQVPLLSLPAPAQQGAANQPTDQQMRQVFTNGFLKGCSAGQTQGVTNQKAYCSCLTEAYNQRYDGRTLTLISKLGSQSGASGPILVDTMMLPERQKCSAK